MDRRSVLVVGVGTLAGCLSPFEGDGDGITEPADLEVIHDELGRENVGTDEERVFVIGVLENVGDRELSYVEIRATFLDEDGEDLETVIENVEDVTSGEQWHFEIEYPHFGERAAEVDDYELEPTMGL